MCRQNALDKAMKATQSWCLTLMLWFVDYTAQQIFLPELKISHFEDFLALNPNIAFMFLCKTAKSSKNAVKAAKRAILGTFWPPPLPCHLKPKYVFFSIGGLNFFKKNYLCQFFAIFIIKGKPQEMKIAKNWHKYFFWKKLKPPIEKITYLDFKRHKWPFWRL